MQVIVNIKTGMCEPMSFVPPGVCLQWKGSYAWCGARKSHNIVSSGLRNGEVSLGNAVLFSQVQQPALKWLEGGPVDSSGMFIIPAFEIDRPRQCS